MTRTRRQAGFTLVELMAASVITAFLAMVAVGGMVSVTSARNSLDEVTEVMDELRFASDLLRQDLSNVSRGRQMLFEGLIEEGSGVEIPRLRFWAISKSKARPMQPEGDLYEIEYLFFEGQDGGTYLARRQCPIVGVEQYDDETAGGVLTKISEKIAYFGIRYFDGTTWSSIWPIEQEELPMLVEVSLASRHVDKSGSEKVYSKQVILTFPRLGDQSALTEEEETMIDEIEFTDPESGLEM